VESPDEALVLSIREFARTPFSWFVVDDLFERLADEPFKPIRPL
jgi:hypothetical protein